ncbi:MAG: hypothetical protein WA977_08765 [Halobacteriota archaeon]
MHCKIFQQFFFRRLQFAKLQLILRCCGAKRSKWWGGLGFKCQARIAHRSPPCKFLGGCSCEGAIDFAVLPILARQGVAGFAPEPNF